MTRIALVLSGTGSLGTYVAGAATELLQALARNRTGHGPRVGVLAGASAGALPAAIAARALVVNHHLIPWIETTWIRGMDAGVLRDPGRSPRASLLGGSVIDELSRALITASRAADDEPSPLLDESLGFGLTLSNLTGAPHPHRGGFPARTERSVFARLHDDWISFRLTTDDGAGAPIWEKVRSAAVAAAALPFAFPPRSLERDRSERARFFQRDAGGGAVSYADGALFNHEPLRLAKRLVLRSGDPIIDWRFILIDPALRTDATSAEESAVPASAARVARLVTQALLRRGSAEDWIRANRTNDRLAILDALVQRLPEIAESLTDPDEFELGRAIGELAEQVSEWRLSTSRNAGRASDDEARPGADPALELLENRLVRIERRYSRTLERVESRAARSRIAKLIFILEAAGGLDDKEAVPLHLVAPRGRLAGDLVGGLGGYFCQDWRDADFRAGRRDARQLLEGSLSDLVSYEPDAEEAYAVPDPPVTLDALPPQDRRRLERLVDSEVERMVSGIPTGLLGSLFGFAWKPAVRRWAAARALEALRAAD